MAAADRPDQPVDPTSPLEFSHRFAALTKAIDDVLVANHTLRASLATGHVPLDAPLADAVARYRDSPLFGLWLECRAVEALRVAWTGKTGIVA